MVVTCSYSWRLSTDADSRGLFEVNGSLNEVLMDCLQGKAEWDGVDAMCNTWKI